MDLQALIHACAPNVSPVLMQALVKTESGFNPYAIGMDAKQGKVKQPTSLIEALTTAKTLQAQGKTFSVGLSQIHVSNLSSYGLSLERAFQPCENLAAGQNILWNFYNSATASGYRDVSAVWAALRGYNSGNVNKTISNDYANKIFLYMRQEPIRLTTNQPVIVPAIISATLPAVKIIASKSGKRLAPAASYHDESLEAFEKPSTGGF